MCVMPDVVFNTADDSIECDVSIFRYSEPLILSKWQTQMNWLVSGISWIYLLNLISGNTIVTRMSCLTECEYKE